MARKNPPKNPDATIQNVVALLSPYQAQRRGLRDMVRATGMSFETRFDLNQMPNLPNNASGQFIRSVSGPGGRCGFPALRNGKRIGFLDSPSRMNVAATALVNGVLL